MAATFRQSALMLQPTTVASRVFSMLVVLYHGAVLVPLAAPVILIPTTDIISSQRLRTAKKNL